MGARGRQPGELQGRVPGSGRRPGTVNKNQLTEDMRKSIVSVFKRMGGTRWLLEWAKENPTEFVRLVLTRILPAAPREEADMSVAIGVQVGQMSDTEAASRIAFVLARAAQQQGIDQPPPTRTIEAVPEPVAPVNTPTLPPTSDPVEDLPPTGFTYAGSAVEQGRSSPSRGVVTKRRHNLL